MNISDVGHSQEAPASQLTLLRLLLLLDQGFAAQPGVLLLQRLHLPLQRGQLARHLPRHAARRLAAHYAVALQTAPENDLINRMIRSALRDVLQHRIDQIHVSLLMQADAPAAPRSANSAP